MSAECRVDARGRPASLRGDGMFAVDGRRDLEALAESNGTPWRRAGTDASAARVRVNRERTSKPGAKVLERSPPPAARGELTGSLTTGVSVGLLGALPAPRVLFGLECRGGPWRRSSRMRGETHGSVEPPWSRNSRLKALLTSWPYCADWMQQLAIELTDMNSPHSKKKSDELIRSWSATRGGEEARDASEALWEYWSEWPSATMRSTWRSTSERCVYLCEGAGTSWARLFVGTGCFRRGPATRGG